MRGEVPERRTLALNVACGLAAGFAATLATQPFDLVKTRIQLQPRAYPSTLAAARRVLADEGPAGFFRGMFPRLMRKTLSSAMTWAIYEEVVHILGSQAKP